MWYYIPSSTSVAEADSLRIVGNGVVPQQAAYAFRELWRASCKP